MGFNPNKIRGLMAEHGYNQSDIADRIQKSEMTVRNKLQGKTEFNAKELATLAELFGVSPAIFFTDKVALDETKNETQL